MFKIVIKIQNSDNLVYESSKKTLDAVKKEARLCLRDYGWNAISADIYNNADYTHQHCKNPICTITQYLWNIT